MNKEKMNVPYSYKDHRLGKTLVRYMIDNDSGQTALLLIPVSAMDQYAERGEYSDRWAVGSLVQLHLRNHPAGILHGTSMRYSPSTAQLVFDEQTVDQKENETIIETVLRADTYRCIHRLSWRSGEDAFEVRTRFENRGNAIAVLDMLSSFSLENLSPFCSSDASERLQLHRYRSAWSLEGRHTVDRLEDLQLEFAWAYPEVEKFGSIGSWPCKKFFPFAAIEDTETKVLWGAQLAIPGSWQMEVCRSKNCVSLSGGLADREFGHWAKEIEPGESFTAPVAYLACVQGDDQDLTHALTHLHHRAADRQPDVEQDLPIVFNEWCTSWGTPTHDKMIAIADHLKGSEVRYIVMDAGWSKSTVEGNYGQGGNGDWEVCEKAFPNGLKACSHELKKRGFITGIWFEFEVTTEGASVYGAEYDDLHIHKDGRVLVTESISGRRSYWDFRNPEAIDLLSRKVIDLLRDNEIGYMKVDYNGNVGLGCDGAESLGEGLRQHLEGVQAFFRKVQCELPHLVIENCASGGLRLEPSMIGITSMSSFSDAHEGLEIPILAANQHAMLLPRQLQIWAVLRKEDSEQRLYYTCSSTFLGRMCLSGDITALSTEQRDICWAAQKMYRTVYPIIKHGKSRLIEQRGGSFRHPAGRQVLLRVSDDEKNALLIYHTFKNSPEEPLELTLPEGNWTVEETLNNSVRSLMNNKLILNPMPDFSGSVVSLQKTT